MEVCAVPAALLAALCFTCTSCFLSILVYIMALPCHEVGHAVIYWLNSQLAIPGPGETWPLQSESSYITYLLFASLLAWGIHAAMKNGNYPLLYGCITALAAVSIVTVLVPRSSVEQAMLLAGQGGEIAVGAVAVLSFYARFPARWNWGKNRFLFLAIGAVSYVQGGLHWLRVSSGKEGLRMGGISDGGEVGAALGGASYQSNGDLDRLIRDFHWTPGDFAPFFLQVFWVTTLLLAAGWLFIAVAKLRPKPPPVHGGGARFPPPFSEHP